MRTRHMNQYQFLFSVVFSCDFENIKIRGSSKEWKEEGTSASLACHCYNADDRITKVSNKFENDMRCECVCCSIGACY